MATAVGPFHQFSNMFLGLPFWAVGAIVLGAVAVGLAIYFLRRARRER